MESHAGRDIATLINRTLGVHRRYPKYRMIGQKGRYVQIGTHSKWMTYLMKTIVQ